MRIRHCFLLIFCTHVMGYNPHECIVPKIVREKRSQLLAVLDYYKAPSYTLKYKEANFL